MSNLDMSEAIRLLAQEKSLSEDALLHVLVDALASAYKRRPGAADEVVVEVNPDTMEFTFIAYDVDEDGNWVNERDDTPKKEELGRIAAQTFRQVMSQRIREVERDRKFEEYANREGDLVTGIIQQTDARYTLLDLGRVEALLPQAEQVPYEKPQPGDRCKAYIVEVRKTAKGPQIVVIAHPPGPHQAPVRARGARDRRRHRRDQGVRPRARAPHQDRRLVERPQRRPGRRLRRRPWRPCAHGRQRAARREDRHRAVQRGPARLRRQGAVAGQGQPGQHLRRRHAGRRDRARPPAQPGDRTEGQNARLAARLTGVRVDIRSETQVAEGVPAGGYAEDDVEYAEGEWVANAETGEMEWHAADGSVMSQAEWAGESPAMADAEAAEPPPRRAAETEAAETRSPSRGRRAAMSRRAETPLPTQPTRRR